MSELLQINVNSHIEKKNGLSYLSWAWAWAEVLKIDPKAKWTLGQLGPEECPAVFLPDGSAMVSVHVTIKDHTQMAVLPVMDHRNKAIKNPDAFAINTAIQRCLAKAIAMHGLGLYIYAGEDLPEGDTSPKAVAPPKNGAMADVIASLPKLSKEWERYFDNLAEEVCEQFGSSADAGAALMHIDAQDLNNDQTVHLWARLPSNVRTALDKLKDERRK